MNEETKTNGSIEEMITLKQRFEENRRRLIALSSEMKLVEWTTLVSNPRMLKKPDKL